MRAFATAAAILIVGCAQNERDGASVVQHPMGGSHTTVADVPGRPFSIRVSSTNLIAVTQQDSSTMMLINADSSTIRRSVLVGVHPSDVVFDRAGSTAFVSGFNDGSVQRVNIATGKSIATVKVGANAYRLALSPDETRLYVSTNSGSLYAMNAASLAILDSASLTGGLQGLALSSNGQTLYVSSAAGEVQRLTASTLVTTASIDVGGRPQDLVVTADGDEVYVANESGWYDVLDGTSLRTKRHVVTGGTPLFGAAMSPDDKHIYLTSPSTGVVLVRDRTARVFLDKIAVGGRPRRITFAPDGLTAFVANEDGWIDVIK